MALIKAAYKNWAAEAQLQVLPDEDLNREALGLGRGLITAASKTDESGRA